MSPPLTFPTPHDVYPAAAQAVRDAAVVCTHTDADGLAAGAIALKVRCESADAAILLPRGVNPFSPGVDWPAGTVAILDQGVRPFHTRPSVFVDHHAPDLPENRPAAGQRVVSGYGEPAGVSTSVLMGRLFPDVGPFLPAVGAAGDYGDAGLKRPECGPVVDGFPKVVKTHVKTLVSLVNAPRRVAGDATGIERVRTALAILLDHDDARSALSDPRVDVLKAAKA